MRVKIIANVSHAPNNIMIKDTVKNVLTKVLSNHYQQACSIHDLSLLTGGAVNQTWRFIAHYKGQKTALILRRAPDNLGVSMMSKRTEARLQKAAFDAGAPVAKVILPLAEHDGLGDGYIMDYIDGETIARKILRDQKFQNIRPLLASQCGDIAAKIHSIDISQLNELEHQDAAIQLNINETLYKRYNGALPTFELAFQWLSEHLPDSVPETLVHGDFRNGNFIVGDHGIEAILDWELAHLGDPMEDIAWLCVNSWRFGLRDNPVGGFGDRASLYKAYEKSSGLAIDRPRIHFWEVLGTLKWGIMCLGMSQGNQDGSPRTVEHAGIGRRVSETEIDLLTLLCNQDLN